MKRCGKPHPSYPKQVRCEEPKGHVERDGTRHFHSFYMRSWDDEDYREVDDGERRTSVDA